MSEERPSRSTLDAVGERLVRVRAEEGIDLVEAAQQAGIAPARLAGAEAGELALSEAEIEALADVYGLDVTQLFGGRVTPVEYLLGF